MGLITRVASAKKGTKSLKTTIPEGIAEFLELSDKDELEWKMNTSGNERTTIVSKKSDDTGSVELTRYSMKQRRKRAEY